MLNPLILNNLNKYKTDILVYDIETSAHYPNGREVNIRTSIEDYLANAKVKWFGAYSYKTNKYYYLNAITQLKEITELLRTHSILVGFNSDDFDFPIIKNNCLTPMGKPYNQVDCMVTLGTRNQKTKSGYSFKGRGELMNYKFKSNSLRCMAETMKLDIKKGNINYSIFHKDSWTEEETKEIIEYLASDVMATKQIFDILWDYWLPFAELIDEKYVYDLSWIKNSIASLTYKSACKVLMTDPTYSEHASSSEEMGGNVITPKYEELTGVYYVDVTSLYPHIFSMFNLTSEVAPECITKDMKIWHGNNLFKVKGHYNILEQDLISKYIADKLKERIEYQEKYGKTHPMVYTLKILLNSLYGVIRSSIFEKVHSPNAGWDCCWLGQQIQQFMNDMFVSFGFEVVAGDTDSLMIKPIKEEYNSKKYVQECLNQIVDIIKDNAPFPVDTFTIKIENYLEYIMFPFSAEPIIDPETGKNKKIKNRLVRERKGKKKNYLYIYKDKEETKIKMVGLPIIKDNSTSLSMIIFKEVLEKQIKANNRAKFSKEYIDSIINDYLQKEEVVKSLAVEYRVQKLAGYKNLSQIQAQISKEYFKGDEGVISLIKNSKVGKVGKGTKYCTVEEAISNKLTIEELDLEKIYNELEPFIEYKEEISKIA